MSVCSPSTAQWRGRMLVERGSSAEEPRRRGARGELRRGCARVMARVVGALGLLDVLLSVGGQSFVAPFFTAPQGQWCVFFLDAVSLGELVGTNSDMRRCCSCRRGQASKWRCSPSFSAPCSSLWVVGVLGLDFRGMALMGRISARRAKRQFEVQRRSSVSKAHMVLCGGRRSPLGNGRHRGRGVLIVVFMVVIL